jgi:hypothetical protein
LKQHIADGLARFKGDAELMLARGSAYEQETEGWPGDRRVTAGPPLPESGRWRRQLHAARRDYQRAFDTEPELAEARLRWGRVQGRLGEVVPAVSALGDVVSSGAPAFLRYLALFFRAELSERAGNVAAARDDYTAALGVWPRAQAPIAALSRLCGAEVGDGCAGPSKDTAKTTSDAGDPLADYRHGQAWRRDERLASFRLRGVPQ